MGWVIFFITSILVSLIFIPFKKVKYYWLAGIISMIMIIAIDSTLIRLGAFSYRYPNSIIGKIPTLYWLSSFFGGIIVAYYYPKKKPLQFPYILLSSFIFLCMELVMYFLGYFNYHNWSLINSFILNIFGFIIVIWLWNWVSEFKIKAN